MALAHRRRRTPFESPGLDDDELDNALDDALGRDDEGAGGEGTEERVHPSAEPTAPIRLAAVSSNDGPSGRRSTVRGPRGRLVRDQSPEGPVASLAVSATVRATAVARADDADAAPVLREAVREERAGNLVVLAVDTSGSMGVEQRMAAVTAAVSGLLIDAYQRRDRVAVIGFRGEGAEVVVRPTGSVEVARARLASVTTGGRTPLAAGIDAALDLALRSADGRDPLLVVVSDGRATAAGPDEDPLAAAMESAAKVRRRGISAVVVDAEDGPTRLGLARKLAEAMGARHLTLDELAAGGLPRP
jgi:magnesium chelatase subunit D